MDYEEGIKLGLNKFEIEDLPNMDNRMIALIIEEHPGCVSFVKSVLKENGKTLDIEGVVNELVYEIDNPYIDPDDGVEDVESKKNALKELRFDYDEIKEAEREENDFEINELDDDKVYSPKPSTEIDENLEQWLNSGSSKTPLQKREAELSGLEKEEENISKTEKLIEQKENNGLSKE